MDYSSDEWIFVNCEQIRNEFVRKYSLYFSTITQIQKIIAIFFATNYFATKKHIFNGK